MKPLRLTAGNSAAIPLEALAADGSPMDLKDLAVIFRAVPEGPPWKSSTDVLTTHRPPTFEKTSVLGTVTIDEDTDGLVQVLFEPEETEGIEGGQLYRWALEVATAQGSVSTVDSGPLFVSPRCG